MCKASKKQIQAPMWKSINAEYRGSAGVGEGVLILVLHVA